MEWIKENIRRIIVALLLLVAIRLPHMIGLKFWLPKSSGTPLYFTAIEYALTCVFAFAFVLYAAWWILRKK